MNQKRLDLLQKDIDDLATKAESEIERVAELESKIESNEKDTAKMIELYSMNN